MDFLSLDFDFSAAVKNEVTFTWILETKDHVHTEDHNSSVLTAFWILLAVNKLLIPGEKETNETNPGEVEWPLLGILS